MQSVSSSRSTTPISSASSSPRTRSPSAPARRTAHAAPSRRAHLATLRRNVDDARHTLAHADDEVQALKPRLKAALKALEPGQSTSHGVAMLQDALDAQRANRAAQHAALDHAEQKLATALEAEPALPSTSASSSSGSDISLLKIFEDVSVDSTAEGSLKAQEIEPEWLTELNEVLHEIGVDEAALNSAWKAYQNEVLDSPVSNFVWNLVAGSAAYASSFGVATLLSRGLVGAGNPWAVALLLLAAPLHTTLSEPLAARLRAVTYGNPASKRQVENHRYYARRIGDWIRGMAGLPAKATFSVGAQKNLTAAQVLARPERGTYLANSLQAFASDDAPFLSFTVMYIAKNFVSWDGPPALFRQGGAVDLGAQFLAGSLAGAATMAIAQGVRQQWMHGPVDRLAGTNLPTVTKPARFWAADALHLEEVVNKLQVRVARLREAPVAIDAPDQGKAQEDALADTEARLAKAQAALAIARQRSGRFSSLALDVRNLFQPRRKTRRIDPELPGNRLDSGCSILGKATSLVAVVIGSAVLQSRADASAAAGVVPQLADRLSRNLLPPSILIGHPGWLARDAYRMAYRAFAGAAKAVRDVVAEQQVPGAYEDGLTQKFNMRADKREAMDDVGGVPTFGRPWAARSALEEEAEDRFYRNAPSLRRADGTRSPTAETARPSYDAAGTGRAEADTPTADRRTRPRSDLDEIIVQTSSDSE